MESQANQVNINLSKAKTKPVFADEIAIAVKVKAFKNHKNIVEKEGLLELIFIDSVKQQVTGEFVISRFTAKGLIGALNQTIEQLEKELANKDMPKQPEIKTASGDSSYIR